MLYTNSEVQWLAAQNGAEVSTDTVKNCNINHATTCLNVAIALLAPGQKVTPRKKSNFRPVLPTLVVISHCQLFNFLI
ncbi:hypothetical protein QUA00_25545 [Microcoleus sp. T2B6]|uniref:hypothetical protein n=1 Tax=Microcoleus sp. T2B6 TaxID=3055424 RepID=UPI002FD73504